MKTDIIRTRIDVDLKKTFESILNENGLTTSKVLRNFIADYVEKEKLKVERDKQTQEALEEVVLGNIVDGEKVMSWLNSWGTEKEETTPI